MNCCVLTSSGGSKNGKRNYSAANRGARAEHHCNSSIDFLMFGSRCRKRNGRPNAEALTSLCQFLADARQRWLRNRCGNQSGPRTVFWFSWSKTKIETATWLQRVG